VLKPKRKYVALVPFSSPPSPRHHVFLNRLVFPPPGGAKPRRLPPQGPPEPKAQPATQRAPSANGRDAETAEPYRRK